LQVSAAVFRSSILARALERERGEFQAAPRVLLQDAAREQALRRVEPQEQDAERHESLLLALGLLAAIPALERVLTRFELPEPDGELCEFQAGLWCGFPDERPGGIRDGRLCELPVALPDEIPFLLRAGQRVWFRFLSQAAQPNWLWCEFQDAQWCESQVALPNESRSLLRVSVPDAIQFLCQAQPQSGPQREIQELRRVRGLLC
jgi:hypothetical protein